MDSDLKIDLLVVDEAHKGKNYNTTFSKNLKNFVVRKSKVLLTGTPVQNNLNEFYTLFEITHNGLFGTRTEFKENFA